MRTLDGVRDNKRGCIKEHYMVCWRTLEGLLETDKCNNQESYQVLGLPYYHTDNIDNNIVCTDNTYTLDTI